MRSLLPEGSSSEWRDATGTVQLVEMHVSRGWYGNSLTEIESATKARIAFLTRLGEGLIPNEHTVLQEGDLVHMMVHNDDLAAVEATLSQDPVNH